MSDQNQKEDVIREDDFAARIGVSRESLREVRAKVLSTDDWHRDGKHIVLRPSGFAKVLAALGMKSLDIVEASSASVYGPASAPQVEVLRVHSKPMNTRLLMATNANGTVLRVRVRSSEKFMPGMQVQAANVQGDLYQHVGRLPRYRGRY